VTALGKEDAMTMKRGRGKTMNDAAAVDATNVKAPF